MESKINSIRLYNVEASINGVIENFRIRFGAIINESSESEIVYALQEMIDDIMDLKIKKCLFFQPNRDNLESKGIITRIE